MLKNSKENSVGDEIEFLEQLIYIFFKTKWFSKISTKIVEVFDLERHLSLVRFSLWLNFFMI